MQEVERRKTTNHFTNAVIPGKSLLAPDLLASNERPRSDIGALRVEVLIVLIRDQTESTAWQRHVPE